MATEENLPRDGSSQPIQLIPPLTALEETYDTSISSTTEITFNSSTTFVEVVAIGEAIMMKWGTSDATTSDWDHVIPEGTTRHFFIPVETDGTLYTAVNFIERTTTAALAMAEFNV